MKILTWNVNGLRALLRKGMVDWLLSQDADVICLQEIKARPDQLKESEREFAGYYPIWNPAERAGYSGTLTLVRGARPSEVTLGLGEPRFDAEGRVVRTRHDGFLLYNIYFPNGQRDSTRLEYKLDFYALLLQQVQALLQSGEEVIITGDFNTAHQPIDLRNPKANAKTSGFLPEERAWIDRYLEAGFVDAFRHLYPDKEQYTWWTYRYGARRRNIGWRIDYYLISQGLLPRLRDVITHDDVEGSDHCPVTLILD